MTTLGIKQTFLFGVRWGNSELIDGAATPVLF